MEPQYNVAFKKYLDGDFVSPQYPNEYDIDVYDEESCCGIGVLKGLSGFNLSAIRNPKYYKYYRRQVVHKLKDFLEDWDNGRCKNIIYFAPTGKRRNNHYLAVIKFLEEIGFEKQGTDLKNFNMGNTKLGIFILKNK